MTASSAPTSRLVGLAEFAVVNLGTLTVAHTYTPPAPPKPWGTARRPRLQYSQDVMLHLFNPCEDGHPGRAV